MSSYNGCRYIKQQIDSILAQEGVMVELYIRDDGSSDNTISIIQEYCTNDLRVQFVEGEPLGVGRSFMTLLSLPIKADYYSFSDQDDYWYPNKLISAVNKLDAMEGNNNLYCCNQNCVNENGEYIYRRFPKEYSVPTLLDTVIKNDIAGCTMVLSSDLRELIIKNLPPFDFFVYCIHDIWIACVSLAVGRIIFDDEPYMDFRRHGGNVTDETVSINRQKSQGTVLLGKYRRYKKRGFYCCHSKMKLAEQIVAFFDKYLDENQKYDLICIYSYYDSFGYKLRLLFNSNIRKSIKDFKILFYLRVIFNKL